MLTDGQIAMQAALRPIADVAKDIGLDPENLELYGKYKAKLPLSLWPALQQRPAGKLILVTAISPTPFGEGKTTVTIGLGQALWRLGRKAVVAIREPSLGPVFGLKGGAAGGGYAQVLPMTDINLHFTGDLHAITAAHNLLAAMLDNHLHQGNALRIDPRRIVWPRVLDMNDRALREVVIGLGGPAHGVPRQSSFVITVASEVMAIFCLARDTADLKERLARIIVAFNDDGEPVTAGDLGAAGAMTVLLQDALQPNLVQTLEGTPALIHGGPFANIAHGCNSLLATRFGLHLGDFLLTEAGFGSDLGAEKFMNIKCRAGGLEPAAAVLVATVRALKWHGGQSRSELERPGPEALRRGLANLHRHLDILDLFGLPAVVAINAFPSDTEAEWQEIIEACRQRGVPAAVTRVHAEGGAGGEQLATALLDLTAAHRAQPRQSYDLDLPLADKLRAVVRSVYGGDGIDLSPQAERSLRRIEKLGYGHLPVCMAKTPYSFTADPGRLAAPDSFVVPIRDVELRAGAGFVVALAGDVMTMPGLPRQPAAAGMDVAADGTVTGLF